MTARRQSKPDAQTPIEIVDRMTLPYGLGADVWGSVVDRSGELSDALSGADSALPDADIEEMATELHDFMRRLV